MIALLAALCLTQGTLLQQIVPQPTGKNGYEEYLRAADVLREGDANLYLNWQTGDAKRLEREAAGSEGVPGNPESARKLPLARRLEAMSVLELRRETVAKFGAALDWVKQGNAKPVTDPWTSPTLRQKFPEFKHFRDLATLAAITAYVRDAEGRTALATDAALQVMEMGDRIGGIQVISLHNGLLMQSTAVAAMGARLDRMSRADAVTTAGAVARVLERVSPVRSALGAGIRGTGQKWLELLAMPIPAPSDVRPGKGEDALLELLSRLSVVDRGRLAAYLDKVVDLRLMQVNTLFSGPESGWVAADPEVTSPANPRTVEEIGDAIVSMTVIGPRSTGISAARIRTQLRLLRLAARVVAFKWDHERLPARLEDAAPTAEIADPLSGGKFQYEPMSDRFRVFSKGVPATGEIDLKYVYPASGPPPPM